MLNDDDQILIARSQAGDTFAFQQLATKHAARVWRCAYTLCRDPHLSDDLVQETLFEAWRAIRRFEGQRSRFSTWLYGILRHRWLKMRQPMHSTDDLLDASIREPTLDTAPERSAQLSEDTARIRHAVSALPEEHRLVVEFRFFAGASLDEIAELLGRPLGTVKSRLHNALEKLRQMNLAVNLYAGSTELRERKP